MNYEKIIHWLIYNILIYFFRIIGLLPLALSRSIGSIIGHLYYKMDNRHRNVAINNIKFAYGNKKSKKEIIKLARANFKHLGQVIFEIAWSVGHIREHNKYFKIQGTENVQKLIKRKQGFLILSAHFGNFELSTYPANVAGCKPGIVYRPLDFLPLEQFIVFLRTRFDGTLISTKDKPFRKIIAKLNEGGVAGLLMDQSVDCQEGVFVDFFGHMTCTNKGMALLALKTESPVIPLFLVREKNGFKGIWLPELPLIKTGDERKDIEANTEQYNKIIESIVRQYPEQWFWVHKRWKTKPYSVWPKETN